MTDKRPGLIAQCAGVADVISAVDLARDNGLLVAVRGGDHSVAGHSVCDGGIMIDLSRMKGVRVDPAARTARAEGGAKWRDFDHETQAFGLATTGGTNSDTGIGGLTLGGGLGWLAGKYGLTCDNLLSADVVTADGRFLTASATENEDLFWGLRGGSGNFGIVTSFEYQLHQVGTVLGGMVIHPFARAKEVLQFYSEFSRTIPDELNTVCVLLTSPDGEPVVAIAVCYNGSIDNGEQVLRPLREFGPPLADLIGPMPYMALQTMLDAVVSARASVLLEGASDGTNQRRRHRCDRRVLRRRPVAVHRAGLSAARQRCEPRWPGRDGLQPQGRAVRLLMLSGWEDPAEAERNIEWTRRLYDEMRPSLARRHVRQRRGRGLRRRDQGGVPPDDL